VKGNDEVTGWPPLIRVDEMRIADRGIWSRATPDAEGASLATPGNVSLLIEESSPGPRSDPRLAPDGSSRYRKGKNLGATVSSYRRYCLSRAGFEPRRDRPLLCFLALPGY
jgi:hypothetical protein